MTNLNQKLEYLKWLRLIGVEYYFSEKKDSDISWLYNLRKNPDPEKHQLLDSRFCGNDKDGSGMNNKDGAGIANEDTMTNIGAGITIPLLSHPKNLLHNPRDPLSHLSHPRESGDPAMSSHSSSPYRKLADSAESLEELKDIVKNFNGCDLKGFATNTVFSDGNPLAKIMLVGEAPGAKEDELGIPFCGESGILLDTMLLTIGLSRKENIYITNTVFWRPPANRKPTNQEMEICRPFLEKHIALINPKLIICVGSTAVADLLGDKITISLARNNIYTYQNKYLSEPINTMSIFHPAYLLRQSEKKKDMWFDLIKIQQFIKKNL